MDAVETEWVRRAIPSQGAVVTASKTAADGHEITADLSGLGQPFGGAHKLAVRCESVLVVDPDVEDDPGTVEDRWPTLDEVLGAADVLAPGEVFILPFVAQPPDVIRMPPGVGQVRQIECHQTGTVNDWRPVGSGLAELRIDIP